MNVLMISGDPNVLNPASSAGKRMEEYRSALGELEILLCHGNIFSFVSGFFRGVKILRQKKFDAITAQDIEHSFLAWIFSKIFGAPWQMQIHTDIFSPYFERESWKNKLRVLFAKFLLPRADCIRVVSRRIKKSMHLGVRHLSGSKIIVLPIFVDIEKFRNVAIKTDLHKKYPNYDFIILMASRVTKEKNIGLAMEALTEVLKSKIVNPKSILLLMAGDGPEKEALRHTAYALGLADNVIFEPATNDLASYYKTCDLFLLASNYEGYGMALVEAAASGAKIISSDAGIAPEILESENIFKVGDKNDLAVKLNSALAGKLKPPKPVILQTKDEYLRLYKGSLAACLK